MEVDKSISYKNIMSRFAQLTPKEDVNTYNLYGHYENRVDFKTIMGVFPTEDGRDLFVCRHEIDPYNVVELYNEVLKFTLRPEIRNIEDTKNSDEAKRLEAEAVRFHLPVAVLGYGINEVGRNRIVRLASISGITFEQALKRIQGSVAIEIDRIFSSN